MITTFSAARDPFQIRFISDHYDYTGEAADLPAGFKLVYTMNAC